MRKRYQALIAALVVAAMALGLVKLAPRSEPGFSVSLPSSRGFGPPCDTSRFTTVTIFGKDRPWHEAAVLPLRAALALAKARSDYRPEDVGTYNCRTIAGSSTMSHHAWAVAVDFDPARNPYGVAPSKTLIGSRYMDFVRAFERVGFTWGGRWQTPDAMHFEWDGPPLPNPADVAPGDAGAAASKLEGILRALGLPVIVDGRYAKKDVLSVIGFQVKNDIPERAEVGPITWTLLLLEAR